MSDYLLASFSPIEATDLESDFIINSEPMKFIEIVGITGEVQDALEAHAKLLSNPQAKDVLIFHMGSLLKLNNAFLGGDDE